MEFSIDYSQVNHLTGTHTRTYATEQQQQKKQTGFKVYFG